MKTDILVIYHTLVSFGEINCEYHIWYWNIGGFAKKIEYRAKRSKVGAENERSEIQNWVEAANLWEPPVERVEPEENNHGGNNEPAGVAGVGRLGRVRGGVVEPAPALVVPSSEGF